jgi:hypothetical protein
VDNSDVLLGAASLALSILLSLLGRYRGRLDFRQLLPPAMPKNDNGGNGQYAELRAKTDSLDERTKPLNILPENVGRLHDDLLLTRQQFNDFQRETNQRFATMQTQINTILMDVKPALDALPNIQLMLRQALEQRGVPPQ